MKMGLPKRTRSLSLFEETMKQQKSNSSELYSLNDIQGVLLLGTLLILVEHTRYTWRNCKCCWST